MELASQCGVLEEGNEKLVGKLEKLKSAAAAHATSEIARLEALIEHGKSIKEQLKTVKKELGGDEWELIKLTAMADIMVVKSVTCRELCIECEQKTDGKLVVECGVCLAWLCTKYAGMNPRTPPGKDDVFWCPESLCQEIKSNEVKKWERLTSSKQ